MVEFPKRGTQSDLFFSPTGAKTSSSGHIDYSSNQVYKVGSDLEVQWATSETTYQFLLYQQVLTFVGAKQGPVIYVSNVDTSSPPGETEVQNFHWTTQLYDLDLRASNVFFLWARTDGRLTFTSDYFNISNAQASPSSPGPASTSLALVSSTALPASTVVSSSYVSSAPSTTPSANTVSATLRHAVSVDLSRLSTASSGSQTSTTPASTTAPLVSNESHATSASGPSKLGIGIVAGVAVCVAISLCILVGYLLARRRRLKEEQNAPMELRSSSHLSALRYTSGTEHAYNQYHGYPPQYFANQPPRELGVSELKELSSRFSAVELPHDRFSRL